MLGRTFALVAALTMGSACSLLVDALEESEAGDQVVDASQNLVDGPRPEPGDDAMINTGDAASTTEACSNVLGDGTCVIDCTTASCNGDIVCPEGRDCVVNCVGNNACEFTSINCNSANNCIINCEGDDACDESGVQCSGDTCTINCVGSAACEDSHVECSAESCNILCEGSNACNSGVCCQGGACLDSCSSVSGGNCECLL